MCPALKAVIESDASYPAITSSMRAASSMVRVIGPISSRVELNGIMPSRLINPRVGRSPTRLVRGQCGVNLWHRLTAPTLWLVVV
jgi:hypothetical protein